MSTWTKAEKNLSDIRDVENLINQKSASLKNEINGFFGECDKYCKILPFAEPTTETLTQRVRENQNAARVAERTFIERAKQCADIKAEVKRAVANVEENFSEAVSRAQFQGLNFN